ncbi:MAG: threonylcarbamoyl-AMP synthase [Bacteroidales bacterium]|nr:threonylcarbamoyl-AMP synthase [Bacteroidales bacterium]
MLLKLYSDNPNRRDITRIADALADGQVVVIPTDTIYAFACSINFKKSVERIAALKGFTVKQAKYSLLCSSLSMASEYIRPLSKDCYQMLRSTLPGPYTYILEASNGVPRHYTNADKTIGIRVPDNPICQAIIEAVGSPLIATSVRYLDKDIDEEPEYITNPELIEESFGHKVDIVVDGGEGDIQPSTVVDLTGDDPTVLRYGKGDYFNE